MVTVVWSSQMSLRPLLATLALALAVVGSVSCDDDELPPRTACTVWLEAYIDCRLGYQAFEDGASPEVNGVTPEGANTLCYAEASQEHGDPPRWLTPDDFHPFKQSFFFSDVRTCINGFAD